MMRYLSVKIVILLIGFSLLPSCEFIVDSVTDDATDEVVYTINPDVKKIALYNDFDLELIESEDSTLTFSGPKALLNELEIENIDGLLEIRHNKFGSWYYDKPLLQLRLPQIVPIQLYGFNDVYCRDTLRTSKINFFADGTGDIHLNVKNDYVRVFANHISNFYLSGETETLSVLCTFTSGFFGSGLKAQNVVATSIGANDIVVYPINSLKAKVEQVGNIFYVNRPLELSLEEGEYSTGSIIYDENK
ncbi:DUF2807 domain-containing protein [Draconibacterium sp. IB214405]|uniref:GIN domain-containing protein n=1 Tax=Draconibacterium sp. IB214405 TaxID=3097352 RepID=UPI002A0FEE3B|nr:DUF2807 domain-containing protein [Draconibacterium sp. IB214405]MDX8338200.1 DUF2807 domain-containing protein [Draconibacterium sp. IB214405]